MWQKEFQRFTDHPTEEMMTDIRKHYRQVTLLEDLTENGTLRKFYEGFYELPGAKWMWPFLLTSLNSYKYHLEKGLPRLFLEMPNMYRHLIENPKNKERLEKVRDGIPEGPARKRYDEMIAQHTGPARAKKINEESIFDHSIWDFSDKDKWAQTTARMLAGGVVTALGFYLYKEGVITPDEPAEHTLAEMAKRGAGYEPASLFIKLEDQFDSEGNLVSASGTYIPVNTEEPLGAFLIQSANWAKLSEYMSDEQYQEATNMFMWVAVSTFTLPVVLDVLKDLYSIVELNDGKRMARAQSQMLNTFKKKVEGFAGTGVKVPDSVVKKVLPDWAAEKGPYDLPLGMKALIDDIARFQAGKSDKLDTHIRREETVDEVIAQERKQTQAIALHFLVASLNNSYRSAAPG